MPSSSSHINISIFIITFLFSESKCWQQQAVKTKKPLVEPIFCNCFTIKISSSSFTSYCPICIVLNSYASSFYINPCPIMEAIEEKSYRCQKIKTFFCTLHCFTFLPLEFTMKVSAKLEKIKRLTWQSRETVIFMLAKNIYCDI